MRKLKLSKKFQCRKRLIRNLLSSLILFEQVKTTSQKGKALKGEMESLMSKISKMDNEVNAKRFLGSVLYGGAKEKAFDYRSSFKAVKIYKLERRLGDGAQTVLVKLIKEEKPVLTDSKDTTKKVKKTSK